MTGARCQSPSLHALVVDDNDCARQLLEEMVTSLGPQGGHRADGAAALARVALADARDEPYNLVRLDWKMPGMAPAGVPACAGAPRHD
jgi:CheY-like chemotaxis protein